MTEKRQHTRYSCEIKTKFKYFEGMPFEIDKKNVKPANGKGHVLDISKSGLFLVAKMKVSIGMLITVKFSHNKKKFDLEGNIVRTGLLENNPSEIAKKFSKHTSKGDSYIAVEFNDITSISETDFQ